MVVNKIIYTLVYKEFGCGLPRKTKVKLSFDELLVIFAINLKLSLNLDFHGSKCYSIPFNNKNKTKI
jgi:hypothetical protein